MLLCVENFLIIFIRFIFLNQASVFSTQLLAFPPQASPVRRSRQFGKCKMQPLLNQRQASEMLALSERTLERMRVTGLSTLMQDLAVRRLQEPHAADADNCPSTYHSRTHNETGGRFAAAGVDKTNITGSKPTVDALASPNWAHDPTGIEPPLGFSIDEAPIVGEWHEIQASLAGDRDASESSTDSGAKDGTDASELALPGAVPSTTSIVKRKI